MQESEILDLNSKSIKDQKIISMEKSNSNQTPVITVEKISPLLNKEPSTKQISYKYKEPSIKVNASNIKVSSITNKQKSDTSVSSCDISDDSNSLFLKPKDITKQIQRKLTDTKIKETYEDKKFCKKFSQQDIISPKNMDHNDNQTEKMKYLKNELRKKS